MTDIYLVAVKTREYSPNGTMINYLPLTGFKPRPEARMLQKEFKKNMDIDGNIVLLSSQEANEMERRENDEKEVQY